MTELALYIVCSHCGHMDVRDAFRVRLLDGVYTGEVKCPGCGEVFEMGCNSLVDGEES